MNSEDRLAILVRASVDDEVRDVSPRPDLAQRAIAARISRRRRSRWRLPMVAGVMACTVVGGVIAALPLLSGGPGERQAGQPAAKITPVPFDPNREITIGYLPAGFTEVATDPRQIGNGFRMRRSQPGSVRSWLIEFAGPRRGAAPVRRISILVHGGFTLDRWMRDGDHNMSSIRPRPVEVRTGRALLWTVRTEELTSGNVLWEAKPKVIVQLISGSLAEDETLKVLRGITVAM